MSRRTIFETEWFKFLKALGADPRNEELYKVTFGRMSDDDFVGMVQAIAAGDLVLPVLSFNMEGKKLSVEQVMKVGESIGVKWFNRLELTDAVTRESNLTPVTYLVLELQVRRQIQHLVKKRSVASSNRVVDTLSGQVTGDSKAAGISLPELTALNAKGNSNGIVELIKVRGGDKEAYRNMLDQLRDTGSFSLEPILQAGTRPKVLTTTNSLLHGMMIESNL